MAKSLDIRQSLVEIEHALFKSFPFPSTSITHVTNSGGDLDECNVMLGVDESILADAG